MTGPAINAQLFERPPCYLCGYNGPSYYQPDAHACAKHYHAQQHVRDTLKPYPNLEAILIGCVSEKVTEWPMIRGELVRLISAMRGELIAARESEARWFQRATDDGAALAEVREELDELKELYEDSCSALNEHMDVYTETVNELKQAKVKIAELEEA